MFFDNLVKEIAICINVGDTSINRELELPSYRGIQRRGEDDTISHGSHVSAIGFDTPVGMLSRKALDAIDLMLQDAKSLRLEGCNSRRRISDFIIEHTDLTDCHLCALNDMMSLG